VETIFAQGRRRSFALFPLCLILFLGAAPSGNAPRIKDLAVQTQDGRTVRFYSELVKGRVVAVNFIFTSCTTVCPLMGVRFARLQQILGPRQDISLISVSIDPANDTPARLASWAKSMGARPGWTLVTGAKSDLDALARSLGVSSASPADHAPLVLIIDDRRGTWQRLDGLTDSAKLARILGDTVASKGP
jgi:protein SCO1/2